MIMVIHGNSIVSNGEEKNLFFLVRKKGYQGLVSGSIKKNTERERALESTVPHTLNKKLKIIFRNNTKFGPGNISVAKNKAQRIIKTKRQSIKVDNYGSLCQ